MITFPFLGGGANGLLGPLDSANLPVWILDGNEEVAPLLKFTFPTNLAKCMVIISASLEQPGNILPAIRRWYRLLDEQIRQHYQPEEIVAARQARWFLILIRKFKLIFYNVIMD